ncbi:hypothetical protein RN001_004522 [Aquatica leii]|uniref:TIL domain-containing protein n=1 Tax=Aquatica leii TaxID=1421715 RepID=A0AAN7SPK1_9COLE|nr:hypothetical protein RN001_004522 [Aquatica leii]
MYLQLCVLAVILANVSPYVLFCRQNEVYKSCNSACPPTCDSPYPTVCTLQCVPGCSCVEGFIKNKRGRCVSYSDCFFDYWPILGKSAM